MMWKVVAVCSAVGALVGFGGCSSESPRVASGGDAAPGSDAPSTGPTPPPPGQPSCVGLADTCQDRGGAVSCCTAIDVSGGTFRMGRSETGSDACPGDILCYPGELPEHDATVSPFKLDMFEVTVGRFRRFVDSFSSAPPALGAGAHPRVPGSGWQWQWDVALPFSKEDLVKSITCDPDLATWTDTPGSHENLPMNCMSWTLAFAFCLWDGGRLPTEAEWEFAASGGDENRLYPSGEAPAPVPRTDGGILRPSEVGTHPDQRGRFGHHDLAGGLQEFVLDWYDRGGYTKLSPCNDCANLEPSAQRAKRGGSWMSGPGSWRAAARQSDTATTRSSSTGVRCAR